MRLFITGILISLVLQSGAQLPTNIRFTNYTRANGLPEEFINNVVQDSRGFLWMGSKEGLIRFDGQHFKAWYANPNDPSKFSNNSISVIGEYQPGRLVFLSGPYLWEANIYNQGLQRVKNFSRQVASPPVQLNASYWGAVDFDSFYLRDNKLAAVDAFPLRRYFQHNITISCFGLHYPYVLLIANSPDNRYVYNYLTRQISPLGLYGVELDNRASMFSPQAFDSINHRLYFSTYFNGNFYIDLQLPSALRYQPQPILAQQDGQVMKSLLTPNNWLMQAGHHGVMLTDFLTAVTLTDQTNGERVFAPRTTFIDICPAGNDDYWVATSTGLTRFSLRPSVINYWQKELGFSNEEAIRVIMKGKDQQIYFVTENESLFRFNRTSNKAQRLDSSLQFCWSAVVNNNEIVATGSKGRLVVYNTSNGTARNPDFLKPFYTGITDIVTLVFRARNGDLWYSCNGNGGIIRNPAGTDRFIQYNRTSSPPAISLAYVHTAAEDSHGNIWWGSVKSGTLLKWDIKQQRFFEYPVNKLTAQSEISAGVNNLYVDGADNLWIALDAAALMRYNVNSGKGEYYDINKGLPTNDVHGITSDASNRVWFGTRKGLCCYIPDRDKIVTFTSYDGFPEDNFDSRGIYFDSTTNLLYAAAKNTISYFDPDTLLSKTIAAQPPVYIDEMVVNGKPCLFDLNSNIILEPDENNIDFSFAAPDFTRNNQLIFQYRLDKDQEEWTDLHDKRSVTFNNLPPGKYVLSVRCRYKGNESWSETTAPLSFTIKTPWYRTGWFIVACLLLSALVIWYLISSYYRQKIAKQKATTEKLQAVEKERTRIATDMHDDFGASLSRIKFISEKMQLTQSDDRALKNDLSKISGYSDEMAEKMNEIVWALNQRFDSYADLVSFCRSWASEYLQDKNIQLTFDQGETPDKKIPGEVRRNIFLIVKEALHNIVKHANATGASIVFRYKEGIEVTIGDNGKGFDQRAVRPFANGLENMRKRMTDIKGTIEIRNEQGTVITLFVKA